MNIRWLGHSSFLITTDAGVRILTDPFDESVGYPVPHVEADVVTISHEHADHNNRSGVAGNPIIVDQPGEHDVCGVRITGHATWHDAEQGARRGRNTLFAYLIDGLHVLHLGDLGCQLEESQLKRLGAVDVLMVPVGGLYTIDAQAAWDLCRRLQPRVILPMHYKLPCVRYDIAPVEEFLALAGAQNARRVESLSVNPLNLSRLDPVVLMRYGEESREVCYQTA